MHVTVHVYINAENNQKRMTTPFFCPSVFAAKPRCFAQMPRWRTPLRRFPIPRSELELLFFRDTWCQHVEHWCFCRCSGWWYLQWTAFCRFFGHVWPISTSFCMFFWPVLGGAVGVILRTLMVMSLPNQFRYVMIQALRLPLVSLYEKMHSQVQWLLQSTVNHWFGHGNVWVLPQKWWFLKTIGYWNGNPWLFSRFGVDDFGHCHDSPIWRPEEWPRRPTRPCRRPQVKGPSPCNRPGSLGCHVVTPATIW